jgi:methylmalonyl-CoA mutase
LPTDYSAKIARDTQLILQKDTGICEAVDPWAGSKLIEFFTSKLIEKAKEHIAEIESYGGMTKAIEQGIPKMRIEEAAAKKQARIDAGIEKIIGVNFLINNIDEEIPILQVNNEKVRQLQIEKIQNVKANRNEVQVNEKLELITQSAQSGKGNLLEAAVQAARSRATLGEISQAIEKAFGRYTAKHQTISGVYSKEIKMDEKFNEARKLSDEFAIKEGRRPRILIAKLGQDGHDRGAKVIATSFADLGFDVDIGPLFQTPQQAAKQAAENDVHILGISSLAAGHKTLVPEVISELKKIGREDIIVIVGGVVPQQDYQFLFDYGVAAVFGPGTVISEAASEILKLII